MDEPLLARHWCHMCSQMVNPVVDDEIKCPLCDGGFVEEMDSTEDMDDSDRTLSLWGPILVGMLHGSRRRRHLLREDRDDDSDNESEVIIRRRRRSSAAIIRLLHGLRSELNSETNNSEGETNTESPAERETRRERERESVILINPFNQAIILRGTFSNNDSHNSDDSAGLSLGDYFVGSRFEMLLQHLTENDPNQYGTPPAQKEAVEALPVVKIEGSLSCPVCLEEFEVGWEAKKMPCNHKFHTGCLLPWLELHSSCPVCRFQMPSESSKDLKTSNEQNQSSNSDGNGESQESANQSLLPFDYINDLFAGSTSSSSPSGSSSRLDDD